MIKHHIKMRADKNIQFRLMNTLIKERLFAQGTKITESPQQLEIQYHCHVLYMTVIRKVHFNGLSSHKILFINVVIIRIQSCQLNNLLIY